MDQSEKRIEPGQFCRVDFEGFQCRGWLVKQALLPGWWICRGDETGDYLVVPETAITPIAEKEPAD